MFLALVSTPIGNLGDMTYRAVEVLNSVDLIAAEDTRRARKLLTHYAIDCPLMAYNQINERRKTGDLLNRVENGERVAMLTDAGTPAVSDPGYLLMREAVERGITPEIIPGVSAVTFAAAASALPTTTFTFIGFLPRKPGKRKTRLQAFASSDQTVILFESPHRIGRLLGELVEVYGPSAPVVLIREATKVHEETLRGTAEALLAEYGQRKWKGEFTIAVWCGKALQSSEE